MAVELPPEEHLEGKDLIEEVLEIVFTEHI